MAASLSQSFGVHAGAQVDDLHAVFIALDNAGDQVGAVDGGDNDHVIVHVGHGHEDVQLGGGVALGGAGLDVDGNAQLLAGGLIEVLHVDPELVGQGDDHGANLDVAKALGHGTDLLLHSGVKLGVQLLNSGR